MLVIIIKMSNTKHFQGWKTKLLQLKHKVASSKQFYHEILLYYDTHYFLHFKIEYFKPEFEEDRNDVLLISQMS